MEGKRFSLIDHPWLFLVVFSIVTIACQILAGAVLIGALKLSPNSPETSFWISLTGSLLLLFIVVPFVLGFPSRSRPYATYLAEIRLTRFTPFVGLVLLGISCSLILILSQAAATLIFRLTQGLDVNLAFIKYYFPIASEFPPNSNGWLISFPSIFEEIGSRGVVLTVFLRYYNQPKAVLFSALGFGVIHAFNILNGRDPVWVAGQVLWAGITGLFYGYITVKTKSLLPAMLVHYLGNLMIYPMTAYLQNNASILVQILFGIILTFGIVPTILMSLWVRFITPKLVKTSSA